MSILTIVKNLPSHAYDIKSKLIELFSGDISGLSKRQVFGIALTTSYCLQHDDIITAVHNEAKIYLTEEDLEDCKMAIGLQKMLCVYSYFKSSVNLEAESEMLTKSSVEHIESRFSMLYYLLVVFDIAEIVIDSPNLDRCHYHHHSHRCSWLC